MATTSDSRREAFRELSLRFRAQTAGTRQTPAEALIREDRDRGHRAFDAASPDEGGGAPAEL